jgi:hypothetical protein
MALVGATLGAVIITFVGTSYQQHRQAVRDDRMRKEQTQREARIRLESAIAELLAAAVDLLFGVRTVRLAHERRTKPMYYLRVSAILLCAVPAGASSLTVFRQFDNMKTLLGAALDADRYQLDEARTIAVDLATVVTPRANRYFAGAALLTLGEDQEIADAVRELTPKVTAVMEATGARKHQFERKSSELQEAMEDFRAGAEKRLGDG